MVRIYVGHLAITLRHDDSHRRGATSEIQPAEYITDVELRMSQVIALTEPTMVAYHLDTVDLFEGERSTVGLREVCREAHEAVGQDEERFRALVEHSSDGTVILNRELALIYENFSAARILGYQSGELSGKDTVTLIHPDDMPKMARALFRLARNPGETLRGHARLKHRDGTWRVIEGVAISLLHIPALGGIVVQYRDITERRQGENAQSQVAKECHLTESEKRVLILMAEGQSNRQIAERLVISRSTVKFHVSNILRKLGANRRTTAVAVAVRQGLLR
jgi:PAS domain S-box-containing protein